MSKTLNAAPPASRRKAQFIPTIRSAPHGPVSSVAREITISDIPDAVFATDLDNRITHWAKSAAAMFGYSAAEAIGRPFGEVAPFEIDDAEDEQTLFATVRSGRTWRGRGTVRLRDGSQIWIESTVKPRVLDGVIVGSVSVARDVTQQIAAQRQLAQEERFINSVLEVAGSLVLVLGPNNKIIRFNAACEQLSGYSSETIIGLQSWELLIPVDERAAVQAHIDDLRAGNFPSVHENHWQTRDGTRRLISWSNTCLTDDRGVVTHVIATGTDITDRHLEQQALAERARLLASLHEFARATEAVLQPEQLTPALMEALTRFFRATS